MELKRVPDVGSYAKVIVCPKSFSEEKIGEYTYQEEPRALEQFYIEGVDMQKALQYVQGNMETYLMIVTEFVKGSQEFQERLQTAFFDRDWHNYRIAAHSVKSAAYSVGDNSLGDFAKDMEMAGKEEQVSFITSRHQKFLDKLIEDSSHMEEALKKQGIVIEAEEETLVDQLLRAIDDFDKEEALSILEQIEESDTQEGALALENLAEVCRQIRDMLEEFNYLDASDLVQQSLQSRK